MFDFVKEKLILSAHDVSEGGIVMCLSEMCLGNRIGASIELDVNTRPDFYLFSETQGIVVLETKHEDKTLNLAEKYGIDAKMIGKTGGSRLIIDKFVDLEIEKMVEVSERTLGGVFAWREECI